MPGLILGMDRAEPPPADTAVECCGRIAGLIHGRNGLTRPLAVPGFCFIHLLQLFTARAGSIHLAVAAGCLKRVFRKPPSRGLLQLIEGARSRPNGCDVPKSVDFCPIISAEICSVLSCVCRTSENWDFATPFEPI